MALERGQDMQVGANRTEVRRRVSGAMSLGESAENLLPHFLALIVAVSVAGILVEAVFR